MAPGMVTMKSFDPPLDALAGRHAPGGAPARQAVPRGLRRPDAAGAPDVGRPAAALGHAGVAARPAVAPAGAPGRRPRAAAARVRHPSARLGEAAARRRRSTTRRRWPRSARTPGPRSSPSPFAELIDQPRHLHPLLRDQRTVAGIGRSWVDEILWTARLSPFRKGSELEPEEVERGAHGGGASAWTRRWTTTRRWSATRCPTSCRCRSRCTAARASRAPAAAPRSRRSTSRTTCSATAREEQTGGRVLKDRRLSRLLK